MNILASIYWDASPEIFSIGFLHIRWYGLLYALTFVVGYQLMSYFFKKEGKPLKDLESLTFMVIAAVIIGARLGHCLFYNPDYYLSNPIEILKIWEGGLASHGAAISIPFVLWLFVRKRPYFTYWWIIDRVVITVALGGLFIRSGNFFNSEIIGTPSDLPWAVVFANVDLIPRHPAQMYEAFTYFAIFLFLFFMYKKHEYKPPNGMLFGLFLVLVFTARFVIEFFKEVQESFESTMTFDMGQLLSIPFVLIGLIILLNLKRLNKPKEQG